MPVRVSPESAGLNGQFEFVNENISDPHDLKAFTKHSRRFGSRFASSMIAPVVQVDGDAFKLRDDDRESVRTGVHRHHGADDLFFNESKASVAEILRTPRAAR